MYLGRSFNELIENIRPLFPPDPDDQIIVARNHMLWLVSIKRSAYIKHHVARVTALELKHRLNTPKMTFINQQIETLKQIGVL